MSKYYKDNHRYDDMLDMPHPESRNHPRMSLYDRAARFAPFAALTGYEDEIEETARIAREQIALDETAIVQLNQKIKFGIDKKTCQ